MDIPSTMKAAVYRGRDDVRIETVSVPRIGRGELLVRVESCGVCGTDLKKIHFATVEPPRIFGHEIAGTIVELGEKLEGWKIGDRVVVHHHAACGKCDACKRKTFTDCPMFAQTGTTAGFEPAGGGFAQFIRVMPWIVERGLIKIPREVSADEACLVEPVNTVLKAVETLSPKRGERVVVIGQGPIGLIFTQILRGRSVQVIALDLLESRLAVARRFGAVKVYRADRELLKLDADVAVVTVPSAKAVEQALSLVRAGGRVLLFAHTKRGDVLTIDPSAVCVDEKQLIGSYSASPRWQSEAARLIFQRKINVRDMITHRFPLEQIGEAIKLASNPTERSLKIVVKPNG